MDCICDGYMDVFSYHIHGAGHKGVLDETRDEMCYVWSVMRCER